MSDTRVKEVDIAEVAGSYNHTSNEQMTCPYEMFARFRNECPVGRSDQYGGFWFLSRFDDVARAGKNFRVFSSADGNAIPKHPTYPMYPIDLDPPLHTKMRALISPFFHVDRAEALATEVERAVDELLDTVVATGECDLAWLSREIPPIFALKLIGVPADKAPEVRRWIGILTHSRNDEAAAAEAGMNLAMYLVGLAAERRQTPPQDDIIGTLLQANVPEMGGELSDEVIFRVLSILLFGGLDTSTSVMLESLYYIGRHPKTRQQFLDNLDNPDFWHVAIEELVRYASPIQALKRQVIEDIELHGQTMKKGDDVMLLWGAANRDERQFDKPDELVLDRLPNRHIGFGSGPHRCIGMYYGKVFLRSVIKGVLRRIPDYHIADDFAPAYKTAEARGIESLPVTFTAA